MGGGVRGGERRAEDTAGEGVLSSLSGLRIVIDNCRMQIERCRLHQGRSCDMRGQRMLTDKHINMKTRFLGLGLALGFCAQALAQLSPGNPLAGLEKLKDFEAMRASSSDPDWRNGNADSRPIEPGGTLVLADLKGPGMITHFWNTISHSGALLLAAADAADLLGRREEPQRGVPDRRFLRRRPWAGQDRSSPCRSRCPPMAAGATVTGPCRSASRPGSR